MKAASPCATVEVRRLVASYRGLWHRRRVLNEVSLKAVSGEITAVVGPNGAGKTTLFAVLLGFHRADRGTCRVGSLRSGEHVRRWGAGYLPETSSFPLGWTVRDVLAYIIDLSSPRMRRAEDFALAIQRGQFDSATLSRQASKCSKGEQRRLGLACALAGDPSLVVLDEPFSGLDISARSLLRYEMEAARARGVTVLFASHNAMEIGRMADRVFILEHGVARRAASEPGRDRTANDLEDELLRNR